jgi:hypothetical protein
MKGEGGKLKAIKDLRAVLPVEVGDKKCPTPCFFAPPLTGA